MLSEEEFDNLSKRMENLSCTNPKAGDGLFTFTMIGEPPERRAAYAQHMSECEFCRTAIELYRYKRAAAKLYSKWSRAKEIVARAAGDSGILKRTLGNKTTAYFQPGPERRKGTTVIVDSSGDFLSVEEQSLDEFQAMQGTGA